VVEICGYISTEFSQMKTKNINILDKLPASVLDLKHYHEEINLQLSPQQRLIKTVFQKDMEFCLSGTMHNHTTPYL
jgi:hypothetical protein